MNLMHKFESDPKNFVWVHEFLDLAKIFGVTFKFMHQIHGLAKFFVVTFWNKEKN